MILRFFNRASQIIIIGSAFALLTLSSCDQNTENKKSRQYALAIPAGFPVPDIPEDNPINEAKLSLGKKLFFEKAISRDSSVSCATCHIPSKAFADNKEISIGINGRKGERNVPSLGNIGYHPYFFREGGNPSLEMQMLGPIQDHEEMDLSIYEAVERLKKDPVYVELAEKAFSREMDAFVLSRSIASFERSLITGNSRFDQYFYQKDSTALGQSEKRGMALFFSDRLACTSCHSGFDFTDYSMQNIGMYSNYKDHGLKRVTTKEEDSGKFKVPSLRNVAITAPYMHDGSLADLDAVIEHFNSGGKGHPNQSDQVKPLGLNEKEKEDLKAFLYTLTDSVFINNPAFKSQ